MTINEILTDIMNLERDERFYLLEILKKREAEELRNEMLDDAIESIKEYQEGSYLPLSGKQALEELHNELD